MADAKKPAQGPDTQFSENEVLARIESILRFTTDELANSEVRAQAFEKLTEFEAQLLYQQRNISTALENVQKYRDEIEKEWHKEKQVRENTLDLMAQRMKDLHQTLRAQEYLLDYAAGEQKFLRELLVQLHNKKSLTEQDVEKILGEHEQLLAELSRKAKK
ncbi:hypothetical protein [Turneriella parva]|uniref:Uncharacterized protein n=1 Tax=Turneriella parva (strain ATCC BAA-1111 / DSM 21527 / NCTC 11395 / H) TaxID=869212 RepID=I4B611_TURPD|nr:hypothetical protein [Turneriella parva]AFM12718.1 hypothetical protein Turpa_2072 [Turneriella parva DSM 21527]